MRTSSIRTSKCTDRWFCSDLMWPFLPTLLIRVVQVVQGRQTGKSVRKVILTVADDSDNENEAQEQVNGDVCKEELLPEPAKGAINTNVGCSNYLLLLAQIPWQDAGKNEAGVSLAAPQLLLAHLHSHTRRRDIVGASKRRRFMRSTDPQGWYLRAAIVGCCCCCGWWWWWSS